MSIPNCVPEYFRSLQDDYDHECELEFQRQSWYEKNEEYRIRRWKEGCAELDFYPSECESCQYGEEASPRSEWDDFPTMICSNWKSCHIFKKETQERFPDTPWDEIVSWLEYYGDEVH